MAEAAPHHRLRSSFLRFYDGLLRVARTPWAIPILCLVALADSACLPVSPDVVLIAVTLGRRDRWLLHVLCVLAASIVGGLCGWMIGHFFWQWAGPWLLAHIPGFNAARFARVEALYQSHDFLPFVAAIVLGIPYCLFTLAAGICNVPPLMLVAGMAVGRGARFFVVALLIRIYGERARIFLETRFKWIALGGAVFFVVLTGTRLWFLHSH